VRGSFSHRTVGRLQIGDVIKPRQAFAVNAFRPMFGGDDVIRCFGAVMTADAAQVRFGQYGVGVAPVNRAT